MPRSPAGTSNAPKRGGGVKDVPSLLDYSTRERIVRLALGPAYRTPAALLPNEAKDIEPLCSPIDDQGENLLACSAHATVGLLEYFLRKEGHAVVDLSRLFNYQQALSLEGRTGQNIGVSLRSTMAVVRKVGALPSKDYWPYRTGNIAKDPSVAHLEMAAQWRCSSQFRLDDVKSLARTGYEGVLRKLKRMLHAGHPCAFTFQVYEDLPGIDTRGRPDIPMPRPGETSTENHSVLAVGYRKDYVITNPRGGMPSRGALRIRNSWGKAWGDGGYGWIPFDYVKQRKCNDFWSITREGVRQSAMLAEVLGPRDPGLAPDHTG